RVVGQIKSRLGANPVPMQFPIGAEDNFEGVVDLMRMQAIYWDDETRGMKYDARDIPANIKDECERLREAMIEAAAEADEQLMEKYLESGELSTDEIKKGIRARTIANE